MEKVIFDTHEGTIETEGNCIESKPLWSENVEHRAHIQNGVFSTKQVPTDCFEEKWEIKGVIVTLTKQVTPKGTSRTLKPKSVEDANRILEAIS